MLRSLDPLVRPVGQRGIKIKLRRSKHKDNTRVILLTYLILSSLSPMIVSYSFIAPIYHSVYTHITPNRSYRRPEYYLLRLEEARDCIFRLPPPGNGRPTKGNTLRQPSIDEFFIRSEKEQASTSINTLSILQWNARSLSREKAHELYLLAQHCNSDIIAVSECGEYHTNIPGYVIRSRDTRGQGVVLFTKSTLKLRKSTAIESSVSSFAPNCILNAVQIFTNEGKHGNSLFFVHVYISPSTSSRNRKQFMNVLMEELHPSPFILCGDLNDRWMGFGDFNNHPSSPCINIYNKLTICNDGSITRPESSSSIDVTMCSETIVNSHWSTINDLGSDHLPIHSEFLINQEYLEEQTVMKYTIKEWKPFIKKIEYEIMQNNVTDITDLLEFIQTNLPRSIPAKRKPKYVWNSDLQTLKRKRNHLRRQKKFKEATVVTNIMRRLFKRLRRQKQKQELLEVANPNGNPFKTLFKVIPSLRKRDPPPRIVPSRIDAVAEGNSIGHQFESISNDPSLYCPDAEAWILEYLSNTDNVRDESIICSEREVVSAIMRTQSKSSPGPDRINGQVFNR